MYLNVQYQKFTINRYTTANKPWTASDQTISNSLGLLSVSGDLARNCQKRDKQREINYEMIPPALQMAKVTSAILT